VRRRSAAFAAAFLVPFATLLLAAGSDARAAPAISADATPVRLQLKWRHQFQFAGFYAALEKGYYREAGFDVTIVPAPPATDSVDVVLKGGADFGHRVVRARAALRQG
jgi:ABC-type nitrate/sulfonate/bicarbonate transport system substrate-binding protein